MTADEAERAVERADTYAAAGEYARARSEPDFAEALGRAFERTGAGRAR